MALHVIFPAAGVGKRFGATLPKQYCNLRDRPVMAWTLDAWRQVPMLSEQVIAISSEDAMFQEVHTHYPYLSVVDGGAERVDSVRNALRFLAQKAAPEDWVMVHDIARPCIRVADITRLYDACVANDMGGILARPLTDTIKQAFERRISATIDRSVLWAAQTPQCFRLGRLLQALDTAQANDTTVTDEASALEAIGDSVQIVEGSTDNLKLTHADDLALAEFYLTQQGR